MNKSEIDKIKRFLSKKRKIVIIPHKNPDGDAIGSSTALKYYLDNFNHNVDDPEDPVLGRFTAAAGKSKSIFIKRGGINAIFEGEYQYPQPELLGDPLPNPITYSAPCKESRYRTAIKPLEWDQ